jgi:transposase
MAYSADIKRLAMKMVYVDRCTYEHVSEVLSIGFTTLKRWIKLNKSKSLYVIKPRSHASRKIDDVALRGYVSANPDAYLSEIAAHLGVSTSGIYNACKRLKISYKKNTRVPREKRREAS